MMYNTSKVQQLKIYTFLTNYIFKTLSKVLTNIFVDKFIYIKIKKFQMLFVMLYYCMFY